MPKLKRGKRSNTLNRTARFRQRKRGVQRVFKPGDDRIKGLKDYINANSFSISDVTDSGGDDCKRADIYIYKLKRRLNPLRQMIYIMQI